MPGFDRASLSEDLAKKGQRPAGAASYERVVDGYVGDGCRLPHTMIAEPSIAPEDAERVNERHASGALARAMYSNYLQSYYPEAIVLAERVLERDPAHELAKLVLEGCRTKLVTPSQSPSRAPRLVPSSVVRLKRPIGDSSEVAELGGDATSQVVLGHVDGVTDVATLAALAGIPRPEALDRLHALLELGMLEVVNG